MPAVRKSPCVFNANSLDYDRDCDSLQWRFSCVQIADLVVDFVVVFSVVLVRCVDLVLCVVLHQFADCSQPGL